MTAKQKKVLIRICIAFVITAGLMIADHFTKLHVMIRLALYLVPYLIVGFDVLKKAFRNICKGQVFDEQFLMAVATIGAFGTGEFSEGVAVMLFYQIGELFQSIAVGKSRQNIADLMDIRPDSAVIENEDGSLETVDPDDVEIGSLIVVNPGERIPIDGVIVDGEATIDTSALTGESVPRRVKTGDQILSGCINLSGRLKIRTEKEFEDSTVSRILELVENSSMKKAKAENFISKFAKYYTPIVCYSALVLMLVPPIVLLLLGKPALWSVWLIRGLTFLVISCPCAVVISVPMSFFGGIGCASSKGILVKGSNYLEALADTKTICFDKTGTLTKGVFDVTGIYPGKWLLSETKDEQEAKNVLLMYAAHAEAASSHPIALSIKKAYAVSKGRSAYDENDSELINISGISDIEEVSGCGVKIKLSLEEVMDIHVGNKKLMDIADIKIEDEKNEGTEVYVSVNGKYAGCITISDIVKENVASVMKDLKDQGIKTYMLTGDTEATAKRVADQLGVACYKAGLLPGDKVSENTRCGDRRSARSRPRPCRTGHGWPRRYRQ